jgi:hypothetical protein
VRSRRDESIARAGLQPVPARRRGYRRTHARFTIESPPRRTRTR